MASITANTLYFPGWTVQFCMLPRVTGPTVCSANMVDSLLRTYCRDLYAQTANTFTLSKMSTILLAVHRVESVIFLGT